MNLVRSILNATVLTGFLLGIVPTVLAAEVVGKFTQVQGGVDVLRGGAMPAVPVKIGDEVLVKDMIRTKSGATAEVTFRDGNILRVAQRSRLDIATYLDGGNGGNRSLSLPRGKVQAVVGKGVKPGAPPQKFEIRTPNAVAGVRGTDYFVFHERNMTGVLVKSGEVYTYNPQVAAAVVTVPAGTVTNVAAKTPPAAPRPATATELKAHEREVATPARSTAASNAETAESTSTTASSPPTTSSPPASEPAPSGEATTPASGATGSPTTDQAPPVSAATTEPTSTAATVEAPVSTAPAPVTVTSIAELTAAPPATLTNPAPVSTTTPVPVTTTATVVPTTTPPPITETVAPQVLAPPTIRLLASPQPITNLSTATFTLSDPTLTYEYILDGSAGGSVAGSTITLSGLADKGHAIAITGRDANGNLTNSLTYNWSVDTVAPQISLLKSPTAVTNQAAAIFDLATTEAGVTYSMQLDGGAPQVYTPNSSLPLSDGAHTAVITAADLAGNVSLPVTYSWTIDATPPTITLGSAPAATTNVAAPAFSLSASEAGVAYTLQVDGGTPQPYLPGTVLPTLVDGPHSATISAVDAAGNVAPVLNHTWTIDTVAPILTPVKPSIGTNTGAVPTLTVQANEPGIVQYRLDNGAWQTFSGTVPTSSEGVHLLEFQAIDPAGNSSVVSSSSLFVGTRAILLGGTLSGLPGATSLPGWLYEFGDKSAGYWEFLAAGTGTPGAAFTLQAGGSGTLAGVSLDGYWQVASSGASAAGDGTISGGLIYTYLGTDRLVNSTNGSIRGSHNGATWNLTASGNATTSYATPLGFVAEVKAGPIWRDSSLTNDLLSVMAQGNLDGLLGGPAGLWTNSATPFTALGVNPGPGGKNDYWFGGINSKNYNSGDITTYDGGTFSGYLGGANAYSAGQAGMNLAAMYVAPSGAAGLLVGGGSGALGAGFWGESGSINRVELTPNTGVLPTTMAADWWVTNTFTTPPVVVTAVPPGTDPGDNHAEGFLVDNNLNLVAEFGNRGDRVTFTVFKPDPTFGVWQRESWGSFFGASSDAVLITNLTKGTLNPFGYITPDQTANIISLGTWGANGVLSGTAYGFWGDWAAGRARLLGGTFNGSYNNDLGTFGGVTTGAWLDVTKYISLLPTARQQLGFPGTEELSFLLSGSNNNGTTVSINPLRIFANNSSDKIKLWASDNVSGSFSVSQLQGEQVLVSGSGMQGLFRVEHAGVSPVSGADVWLAEVRGLGQQNSGFGANFEGVAVGTFSGTTFTGTAAGTTHPLTYASNFATANMLKRFNGSAFDFSAGSLHGIFGGMSLWGASDLFPADFEVIGVRSVVAPLVKSDYVFSSPLDSYNATNGTMTTLDGGAYRGYFVGALAQGASGPDEQINGGIAALYAAPDGSAGIINGKFNGYLDMQGIWQAHGEWFPVPLLAAGSVDPTSLAGTNQSPLAQLTFPAAVGNFAGQGSIASVASLATLDRQWLVAYPDWGTFRLTTAGNYGYSGTPPNQWAYPLSGNDGSYFLEGAIIGDRWEVLPPMPPATIPAVGKLHGRLGAAWVDMAPAAPKTGIMIGETLGTFDPQALTWQAVATGAWLETATYLALAGTAAGQATLERLNIPAFEIGSADFSGSSAVSADSLSVNMTGVKFLAPTAGGRPVVWATGTVTGNYTGNPLAVGAVTLNGSSPTVSGLAPTMTMQSFSGGKWGGSVTTSSPTGIVGGWPGIGMSGMAAGSYTGTGAGTLSGTAAGLVK